MNALVLGVRLYRMLPLDGRGADAMQLALALGLHVRSVQRHLACFEAAGLARRRSDREPIHAARWWRVGEPAAPKSGTRAVADERPATGQPGGIARVGGSMSYDELMDGGVDE